MKIGLIADDTLDKPDGVQQYMLGVGGWLTEQGHEVHYIVSQSVRSDLPHVHSIAKNFAVRFNGNKLNTPLPASRKRIKALLAAEKFDVLHVQMPYSPFMAHRIIMAAPKETALIGTFHILPHTRFTSAMNYVLGYLLRRSLRRLDHILAVSPAAKKFADSSFRVSSAVLPNTIKLMPFFHAQPFDEYANKPTIVYLNRLEPRKGPAYLVRAIEYLVRDMLYTKPFQVVLCGKGALHDSLQDYIVSHNLNEYITMTGFVPEKDKARYLASADIAVYPSTGGESFGIVLIEALAASPGVVLGGNNPGYASVLAPFKDQLFDAKDSLAFAKVLQYWLDHPKERALRAMRQQKYAHSFDTPKIAAKILELYTEVSSSKHKNMA